MIITTIVSCLIFSSFLFPSLLSSYSFFGFISNRIPLGGFIFVIDELIILIGLIFVMLNFLIKGKVSSLILTKPSGLVFLFYLFISFLCALFLYEENSRELVLRNRWIFLNALFFTVPFILQYTFSSMYLIINSLLKITGLLASIKIILFIFYSSQGFLVSIVSPDFSFYVSLSYLIVSLNSGKKSMKNYFFVLAGTIAILSSQMSSMILFIISCFGSSWFIFRIEKRYIFIFLAFVSLGSISLIFFNNLNVLVERFNLNILNFSDGIIKVVHYFRIWSSALETVYENSLIVGVGIGKKIRYSAPSFIALGDAIFYQSLSHNMIITIIFSFGLVGFILFLILITEPIFISIYKIRSNPILLTLKFLIISVSLNFLTTPGIWKIRKGVIFWLLIGFYYFMKDQKVNHVDTELI